MDTATCPGWSTVQPLPLPPPKPRPLLELRPRFESDLGDTVAIGFDDAMQQARQRATERGHRQVVTRCYDAATRIAHPPLARFWCVQDWR